MLINSFRTRFDGSDISFNPSAIKQQQGESCTYYFTRFLSITSNRALPETLLVNFFVDGLLEPLKCIVMPQELSSLDNARLAALRAETTVLATSRSVAAAATNPEIEALTRNVDLLADILHRLCSTGEQPQSSEKQQYQQRDSQHRNGKKFSNSGSRNRYCSVCDNKGHTADRCYTKKAMEKLGVDEVIRRFHNVNTK